MSGPSEAPQGATFFGKVPARSDFIKGSGHPRLLGRLDQWVSGGMALLSDDPRWKTLYDNMPQIDFAFVGARSRVAVVGHLRSSCDASRRRFPFLAAAAVERADSLLFRCGPISFSGIWQRLTSAADQACRSDDPGSALQGLAALRCADDVQQALRADPLGSFVRQLTLRDLQALFAGHGRTVDLRRIVLAIGLLLRPVLGNPQPRIDKGVELPLPQDAAAHDRVAALWLYLTSSFLRHSAVELQLLLGRDRLVIGFNGASPRTLLSLFSPGLADGNNLILEDPAWVDEHPALQDDYGVAKLSGYLQQPDLSLQAALQSFREVFLGE